MGGGRRRRRRGNRVILLHRKTISAVLRERERGRGEEGGATDPAEDRTEETQTDKDGRRRSSVGYADPDSGYSLAG